MFYQQSDNMICVIALIVFGILGIFSAKYRTIAKEAFNCVFKKVTFRKCDSNLDTRLKSEITGAFMRWWAPGGRFFYRYFEIFSWAFLILTLVTLFFFGQGVYFYAKYGNCNGANSNAFCIFDPLGTNHPQNSTAGAGSVCAVPGHQLNGTLTAPAIGNLQDGTYLGNPNASVIIIEFGCYSCHYTMLEESTVKKVVEHYSNKILYIYKDFPLTLTHPTANLAAQAAHCALEQGKYWEYRDYLFANQPKQYEEDLVNYANELSLNVTQFKQCLNSGKYNSTITENYDLGINSGITVTPTFFINNESLVGAEDYSAFKKIINKDLGIPWWEFWK